MWCFPSIRNDPCINQGNDRIMNNSCSLFKQSKGIHSACNCCQNTRQKSTECCQYQLVGLIQQHPRERLHQLELLHPDQRHTRGSRGSRRGMAAGESHRGFWASVGINQWLTETAKSRMTEATHQSVNQLVQMMKLCWVDITNQTWFQLQ